MKQPDPQHVSRSESFSALADIRKPDINMAIAENIVPQAVTDYLLDIDYHREFVSDWNTEKPPLPGCLRTCGACLLPRQENGRTMHIVPAAWKEIDPHSAFAIDEIRNGLAKFPEGAGREALVENLLTIMKNFSHATNSPTINPFILIKNPADQAGWHRDNYTDMRGLVTFVGPGTYWRPNDSVPAQSWKDNHIQQGERSNEFGIFGKEFMDSARGERSGSLMIWKGDSHFNPLIHSETSADVDRPDTLRVLMILNKPDDMVRATNSFSKKPGTMAL